MAVPYAPAESGIAEKNLPDLLRSHSILPKIKRTWWRDHVAPEKERRSRCKAYSEFVQHPLRRH
jgi:hypothetical protein